jgi:hypothetical protein
MGDPKALGELFHKSETDQAFQDDLAARAIAATARQELLNTDNRSFFDDSGFLLPKTPSEGPTDPNYTSRIVTLPKDELERIANDPALLDKARAYVTEQRAAGKSIAEPPFSPHGPWGTSFGYSRDNLLIDQLYDSGAQVRIYADRPFQEPGADMPMNGLDAHGQPYQQQPDSPLPRWPAPTMPMPEVQPRNPEFVPRNISYSTFTSEPPGRDETVAETPADERTWQWYFAQAVQPLESAYVRAIEALENALLRFEHWIGLTSR